MTLAGTAKPKPRRKPLRVAQKVGYHHGSLSEALLDGGLHLLQSGGIAGLTLRECARLAGVSQAAIRNHFPDKNALLAGLAARGFQELARRRGGHQQAGADLSSWLLLIIDNYVGFAIEYPDLFRLMFAYKSLKRSDYPVLNAAAHEGYDALCAALDAILKAERLDQVDVETATFMLWSGMHGVAMLVIDDQYGPRMAMQVSPQQRCRQLAQLLAAGLRGVHGARAPRAGLAKAG